MHTFTFYSHYCCDCRDCKACDDSSGNPPPDGALGLSSSWNL